MPGPYHIVRASAAAATAVNAQQNATNDSAGASVGAITTPKDSANIIAVYGGFAVSTWTVTSVGTVFAVRLTGNALYLTQDLACNGVMDLTTTPGDQVATISFYLPLAQMGAAIPLSQPGNQISVQFTQVSGVSLGTWSGCVTIVFL